MAFTQNASDFPPFFHRNSEGANPGFAPKLRSTGSGLRLGLALPCLAASVLRVPRLWPAEARGPLKTIPREVIQSALLAGAIFTLCAYSEVLGWRSTGGRSWPMAKAAHGVQDGPQSAVRSQAQ